MAPPPWVTPPLITTSLFMRVLLASTTNSPVFRVMLSAAAITMDLMPRTCQRPVAGSYSNQPPSGYSVTHPSTESDGGANWYDKGCAWAVTNGVSDGTNPNADITREQLVTMLYRYAGSPTANGKLDNFSDSASVSSYAADAMQWAVANGIVNGSNGKLNPQNNATRAQVAAILMRFCEMSK